MKKDFNISKIIMFCRKDNSKKVFLFLTFFGVGILFYILNCRTPLFADDYSYLYSWYDGERITGLKDIFLSQYRHYFVTNGRVILHFLSQLFLWLGKDCFNVINTIGFLILGILIFYHGVNLKLKNHISLLIFIYGALFIFTPAFGESFLWVTGASNYLYGIELILFYLIPYRYIEREKSVKKVRKSVIVTLLKLILMFLFGILVGWTNENLSIAVIAIVFAFLIKYKLHKIRIVPWMIGGWVGNILGCIFLLSSPGQLARLNLVGRVSIKEMIENIIKISVNIVDYFAFLILLFVMIGFYYIYQKNDIKITKKYVYDEINKFSIVLIYLLGFLGAAYSMIVSPFFPTRVWSGLLVLFLIILLSFYVEVVIKSHLKKAKHVQIVFISTFILLCSCIYINAYVSLNAVLYQYNIRMAIIEECIEKNQNEAYMPSIRSNSKYSCFEWSGDLGWDSDTWPNTALAKYYGIPKIIRDDTIIK